MPYQSILHPNNDVLTLQDLEAKVSALEASDQKYALRGGSAVTYDSSGRIATLVAGTITGTIVNAQIASIDYAKITNVAVTNADIVSINASKITAGDISSARMQSNVVSAIQADISTLSAITANMGTLTAGSITGGTITGVTITGGTIRTASSGSRAEMDGSNNLMGIYSGSNRIIQMDSGGMWVRGDNIISFGGTSASGKQIEIEYDTTDVTGLLFRAVGGARGVYFGQPGGSTVNAVFYGGIEANANIDMQGTALTDVRSLRFNTTSSNLNDSSWQIWGYDSGEKGFRCRVNGSLYQFDLTSK